MTRHHQFLAVMVFATTVTSTHAQIVRQLTDGRSGFTAIPAIDDAGSFVYAASPTKQFGDNPAATAQIVRFDAALGGGQLLTHFNQSVHGTWFHAMISVSDDGQWLAFISPDDLTGQNHDRSHEVFVMKSDGTQLQQLTNDPALTAGSTLYVWISGTANKVLFVSNSNLTGNNPNHRYQLFVINRDGTGIVQLTNATTEGGYFYLGGISDDGTRVVFSHNENPTGGNADGSLEVFAVDATGANLHQISSSTAASIYPAISGNGAKITFESSGNLTGMNAAGNTEVFACNFDGTGMFQVTSSGAGRWAQWPQISDDGVWLAIASTKTVGATNPDGGGELWKIKSDGTGLTALTNSSDPSTLVYPAISGTASRIAFIYVGSPGPGLNTDLNSELFAVDINGTNLIQLSDTKNQRSQTPDITPDGSRIVFASNEDLTGGDGDGSGEIYRIQADGTGLTQVTNLTGRGGGTPTISTGGTIVFSSTANPLGTNGDGSEEIFLIQSDGTGLRQLTAGASGSSMNPAIAADGSKVVFDSTSNLTAQNPTGNREIYKVNADGTALQMLTNVTSGDSAKPRIDGTGTWIAFHTTGNLDGGSIDGQQVYRIRSDGTGLQRLTSLPGSAHDADIDAAGAKISYIANENPLGTNPELNNELFVYTVATATHLQLTMSDSHSVYLERMSRDGLYAYFGSDEDFFEEDDDYPPNVDRVSTSGGAIERASALRLANFSSAQNGLAVDQTGGRVAFEGAGNLTGGNPDVRNEIFVIDRGIQPVLRVSAKSPTVLAWDVESGPIRYDVVRGSLSNLQDGGGGTVSLGTVVCLEDDSPDSDTIGFADPSDPSPGQGFFYLYRGSTGLNIGPGTFGTASDGRVRTAGAGNCSG